VIFSFYFSDTDEKKKISSRGKQRFVSFFLLFQIYSFEFFSARKRLVKEKEKEKLKQTTKKNTGVFYPNRFSTINLFFCKEVKITKKRQSDGESIDDDDEEQLNGYTDENQKWLKPKKTKVLQKKKLFLKQFRDFFL